MILKIVPKVAQLVGRIELKYPWFKKDHKYVMQAENFRKMILTLNDDVRVI
jgi:GTP pyrophosphokinase